MSWQERFVKTQTEKELYNLIEPIFRKRTEMGDESVFGILHDLREESQQKELIDIINTETLTPSQIVLKAFDIDLRDNPEQE